MIKLAEIISKTLFINSLHICQSTVKNDEFLQDINLRVIKKTLLSLTEKRTEKYYDTFVKHDLFYSLPELFSSDIVNIPKNLTGVREYRFFSSLSYILYNAVGLLFVDCTADLIGELDFKGKNIFVHYPTKFYKTEKFNKYKNEKFKWSAKNDYKTEYKNFQNDWEALIKPKDIVLQLDISSYFESIPHEGLISLLNKLSPESTLKKHKFENDSNSILEFYFESLMRKKHSIPQGKKNLVSDYFGYLYLVPFDLNISKIIQSNSIEFKGLARYVDDIIIVLKPKNNSINSRQIFKELLLIEGAINSWLQRELGLSINSSKTVREIIKDISSKKKFIAYAKKSISSPFYKSINDKTTKIESGLKVEDCFEYFFQSLKKFKFEEKYDLSFNLEKKDKENLKYIFDRRFQNFIFKDEIKQKLIGELKETDFELISDYINILIVLFYLENKGNPKEGPFLKEFNKFLKSLKNINDKRFIHILLVSISTANRKKSYEKLIIKNKEFLQNDDYGKYLALIYNHNKEINCQPYLIESIYKRIANEYINKKIPRSKFMFPENKSLYLEFLDYIIKDFSKEESLIRQLKYFVYNYWTQKWDQSFNYFFNIFQQVFKIKYSLTDDFGINKLIKKLKSIDANDELLIRKFSKRRNFNLISHSSQKGIPSVKVNKNDLDSYLRNIFPIIIRELKLKI